MCYIKRETIINGQKPKSRGIQDTLFSFHFYYYGLWFWGSTIDRQVQPFNQTLQPQLTAIVVEYEYEYLMVYPETTPLPMETISLHSNSVLSGLFEPGLNSFVVPPNPKKSLYV